MKTPCQILPMIAVLITALIANPLQASTVESQRPNIVWLVSEDNSTHYLRLYDEGGAPMPNVERLAQQGIVFNNAFANSPVCSTARSSIISGCYGPRVFTQFHRRSVLVPLPEGLEMFPAYLRRAGYYTTNNSKEDYNFIKGNDVWDDSSGKASYRNRKPGQPFFHVQNYGATHEGQLHFKREEMESQPTVTDPETVAVFPIHPDTASFRYTNARYRDLHMELDREIGEFIEALRKDGLMEETIIFYYGDHGGVLPGSKGYIYERGLHVPMVVYVPEKWKDLFPVEAGTRVDGFVQFVDLAPTVLNLAGVDVPGQMDGLPFLGKGVNHDELESRDTVFSYADRFDEKYDMVRAIRKGQYKYMRNYQPFNVDGLQNNYRFQMLAYEEWRELYKAGKLTSEQAQFFEARPVEALYDLDQDPFELKNLAGDRKYREVLKSMREALQEQVKSMPDLSFIPEPVLFAEAANDPSAYGQNKKKQIARLVGTADLSLKPFKKARKGLARALESKDPLKRYWALIACSSFGTEAESFAGRAREMATGDPDNLVRMRSAEFLALTGLEDPRPVLTDCLKQAKSLEEAALILNTITLLHDSGRGYTFKLDPGWVPAEWLAHRQSNVTRRFAYINKD
ncbi:sulfatase-like hydrolase/transferase [Puniceicoccales bacterium CK1056]|uniref:Sulfatase-like hydrolase/transferase n=1 Tax=Oceanipulchritudo coccoides TaxID=2706888 RepID=A0A6B2LY10_9BACT|nr:sulfatase-like hydrolase/transferase [Oceanipulchritudo coccoides]NDV61498.1 sulfatase-like hydrolase/transferase [Oceanipulchritudo coccoides]